MPLEEARADDTAPATWADTDPEAGHDEPGPQDGNALQEEPEEEAPLDPSEALTRRRRRALDEARRNGLPPRLESWRKRTATGAVLTGFALGFRDALDTEQQKPAIIMEASGEPPSDLPVDAEVDQIRPADNVVRIRPWLLPEGEEGTEAVEPGTPADDRTPADDSTPADDGSGEA